MKQVERTFRVIPIAMSIKNNGVAEHDDVVSESQLNSPAFDLIRDGFIEEIDSDTKLEIEMETEAKAEAEAKAEIEVETPKKAWNKK